MNFGQKRSFSTRLTKVFSPKIFGQKYTFLYSSDQDCSDLLPFGPKRGTPIVIRIYGIVVGIVD